MNKKELILKAQNNDKECLSELINSYECYMKSLIRLFNLTYAQEEEIYNSAVIGLLTALKTFDISKGFKLHTYATGFIKREIVKFIKLEILSFSYKYNKAYETEAEVIYLDSFCKEAELLTSEVIGSEDKMLQSVESEMFIESILSEFPHDKDWLKEFFIEDKKMFLIAEEKKVSMSYLYSRKRSLLPSLRREVIL